MTEAYSKETPIVRDSFGRLYYKREKHSGNITDVTIDRGFPYTFLSELNGSTNPRWRDQVASGRQAATILDGVHYTIRVRPGYQAFDSVAVDPVKYPPQSWWTISREVRDVKVSGIGDLDPSSIPLGEANSLALENFGRKVRKKQQTFMGGVAIGELAQSIALIRNPARSLRNRIGRYMSYYRHRARRLWSSNPNSRFNRYHRFNLRNLRREIADTWLEYQLGWKPLINDVADGLEAFANHYHGTDDYAWENVRGSAVEEDITTSTSPWGITTPTQLVTTLETKRATVRYMGSVDVGSLAVYDAKRMGVNAREWPVIAWELIPYSFVIDYFTNIGRILENAAIARSSLRWIVKTTRQEHIFEHKGVRPIEPNATSRQRFPISAFTPQDVRLSAKVVHREPYSGSLVPDLRFHTPGGSTQWLNMGALISNIRDLKSYLR